MDLSPNSFVSIDQILSDVLKIIDDAGYKTNSKGWYISQIQQALEELSFDTFFNEYNQSFDIPKNLRIDMPKGAFNLRQLYLFNGDDCNIREKANVYHKNHFIGSKSGNGYVADDNYTNSRDPFFQRRGQSEIKGIPNDVYFFSMQNGMIMLSENSRKFQKVMMVYNGVSTNIGEVPIVPLFFRQAVKDYVLVEALPMKMRDTVGTAEYNHWAFMHAKYDKELNLPYDGSWAKAEHRSKQLNHKERQDVKMYFQRMNY